MPEFRKKKYTLLFGISFALTRVDEFTKKAQTERNAFMSFDKPISRIAIVGTGVIRASWAAQYLARGFDVIATNPASIGKKPIHLIKGLPGHVGNRLQAALYKGIMYLIHNGVLSLSDADDAVSYGAGLRWG